MTFLFLRHDLYLVNLSHVQSQLHLYQYFKFNNGVIKAISCTVETVKWVNKGNTAVHSNEILHLSAAVARSPQA